MPLVYLMMAFHAVMLAPLGYWQQPAGALLAICVAAGTVASVWSLAGRVGCGRTVSGVLTAVATPASDITAVSCTLGAGWPGHRAGQFAFVRFDGRDGIGGGEGAHPYTIASADHGDLRVEFRIKALGDFTTGLADRIAVGQTVQVEGPYGRFVADRHDPAARQVWIGGGIGITPFLAWLDAFRSGARMPIDAELHYCTADRDADPIAAQLQSLCADLPGLQLRIHGARQGERLSAGMLIDASDPARQTEFWFCGPAGLAAALRSGLQREARGGWRWHQEAFALR
jgi:predicted ferric reductase